MQRCTFLSVLVAAALVLAIESGCTQSKPAVKPPENHMHGQESKIAAEQPAHLLLRTTPERPTAGEPVEMQIMLHDASGQMLKEFEPIHEKLAHLVIVREGLDEFAHLHPSVDESGNMTAAHTFPIGGTYLVFLDHKPAGRPVATSQTKLSVAGESRSAPTLAPNVPGVVQGDGLQANVFIRASTDHALVVAFEVQDESGEPVGNLEPYLGAMGHLVVVSGKGGRYVHAHPLTETAPEGKVEFEVHFPESGLYKGWGQFQRGGKVFTIPAVMNIETGGVRH